MRRQLSLLLFVLPACAAPETQRELERLNEVAASADAVAAVDDGAPDGATALAPDEPVPVPTATPGPDAPPILDSLAPWFAAPPLSEALSSDDEHAIAILDAFAQAHPEDPRALAARLQAAWLLAERDADAAAERFSTLALDWPLMSDFAALRAAELSAATPEAALALLDKVGADSVHGGRALLLRSRLLRARPDGARRARAALEEEAKRDPARLLPESWQELVELRLPDKALAQQATLELAVRHPQHTLGKAALKALTVDALSGDERVRLGRALFDSGRYEAMRGVLGGVRAPKESACAAWILLGRAAERKKRDDPQALDKAYRFYAKALACDGEARADATFLGGRARIGVEPKVGRKLLEAHVAEYPRRSTADDALLLLAESEKRPKKAMKALLATLRSYPQGDMADAVAWDLVGPSVEARRWKDVLSAVDQVLAIAPGDVPGRHPGRYRYWRARALWELGKKDEANHAWREVFAKHPFSWYAVLAMSRLASQQVAGNGAGETLPWPSYGTLGGIAGPPDLRVPAELWREPHFRRAVEWARLAGARYDKPSPFLALIDAELDAVPAAARPAGPDGNEWAWTRIAVQQLGGGFARSMRLARSLEAGASLPFPVGADALVWKLAYPRPFASEVQRWAGERALDPNWIWAVMRVESNFDPQAVSWANAIGLMQIILPTAENLARDTAHEPTRENLMRPEVALELGTKYLKRLLDRHKVVPLASAGYNAGGGAVAKWRKQFGDIDVDEFVERIPYREAHLYAKSVTQTLARYLWLYQGTVLGLDLSPVGPPPPVAPPTE